MGLTNCIVAIPSQHLQSLFDAFDACLVEGHSESVLTVLENLGIRKQVLDELDTLEVITHTSFFRRTKTVRVEPPAGVVIERALQTLSAAVPAKLCDADKAFQMLRAGEFDVDLEGIEGIEHWFRVVDCSLDTPESRFRTGDLPDYVTIPVHERAGLALTTDKIRVICSHLDDAYVTSPLDYFAHLLRHSNDDALVSMLG